VQKKRRRTAVAMARERERERERACIPKEIKYVEEKTKGTGDGA
jgi:uncharacterized radical SAM superfamily Fe-S cluster-containing enzyme